MGAGPLPGRLPALRRRRRRGGGAAARPPRRDRPGRRHGRRLHQRPGVLPRRARLVRQALHVPRVARVAVRRALPADGAAGLVERRPRAQRGLRADVPRARRCRRAPAHAGPLAGAVAARRRPGSRRLADRDLLPLLGAPRRHPPRRGAPGHPHQGPQARALLRLGLRTAGRVQPGDPRRVGALRPRARPRGAALGVRRAEAARSRSTGSPCPARSATRCTSPTPPTAR